MSKTLGRRLLIAASFLFSQGVVLLILQVPSMPSGSWLTAFRGYFNYDQLSYAAIATNSAAGIPGLPEPFTETGHSFYPSLWYRILGWLSSLTGASVPSVWTIAGWLAVAACVGVIGFVALRLSRQAWAPALVGPALCLGTLSVIFNGDWFTTLESHAKLWGPYGALYVLNAEVAGFACIGTALALMLWSSAGQGAPALARVALLTLAAGLIGLTANIQTYAFFVGIGISFSWAGVVGLLRSRSRTLLVATAILILITVCGGRFVASHVGALPAFALLVACTLPGAGWLVWKFARLIALPLAVLVGTAAPQAFIVLNGFLDKDPFLTYRQDQSGDLGVPWWVALLASLPILSIWIFNVVVQRRAGNTAVLGALGGMAFSGIMLTFNGVWGFSQEPYRLWIDSVALSALLLAPISAMSVLRLRESRSSDRGVSLRIVTSAMLLIVIVSLLDFGAFRVYVATSGMTRFDTARADAIRSVTTPTTGLIAYGPCVDPQELKIISRKPVAYYNLGIAWPENKAAIDAVVDAYRAGAFSPEAMRAAHVAYLLTDSACTFSWPVDGDGRFFKSSSIDYSDDAGSGTITLWRVL